MKLRLGISMIAIIAVLISSIACVHATSVAYIKTHRTPSTFQDPSGFYDGYAPGTNIRFHIYLNVTLILGGPVVAITNLTITDTLPAGFTYVSGSEVSAPAAVSFSVAGQVLVWNWSNSVLNTVINPPEVGPGVLYEATAEFNATVNSNVPDNTYLTNIAQASYNEVITQVLSQPATTDTVWIARPILDIIKESPGMVENGSSFSYVLTINNTGHFDAIDVNVSDFLSSGVKHTPSSSTASSGSFAVDSGTQVVWTGTIGNVSGTHIVTVTIPVTANTAATSVSNSAVYTAYPSTSEFTHANATCTTQVLHPNIDVTKSGPTTAMVGDTITYTIVVTNTGDCPLFNVTVFDSLLGPIYSDGLALGETKTFTATYTIPPSASNPLLNTVTASGKDILSTTVSDTASWSVHIVTSQLIGGYSVEFSKRTDSSQEAMYVVFVAIFAMMMSLRKVKRKN